MRPSDLRWKVSSVALDLSEANPDVVLREHEVVPRSYMGVSNLRATMHNCQQILALLNEADELPAWVEEMLTVAKSNTSKALDYIRGEKSH